MLVVPLGFQALIYTSLKSAFGKTPQLPIGTSVTLTKSMLSTTFPFKVWERIVEIEAFEAVDTSFAAVEALKIDQPNFVVDFEQSAVEWAQLPQDKSYIHSQLIISFILYFC